MTMTFRDLMSFTLIAASAAALAGCSDLTGEPTRQITSPSPPGTFYTSVPIAGEVAQAAYLEPAKRIEPAAIKPFEAWSEQEAAADALGRIGPAAVPALIQALHSPDADVRLKATEVLARMGSDAKEAVPDLVLLLDDPDERIRKAATRTLGRIGPESANAVPALMRSLLQAEPEAPTGDLQPVPVE